jgi:hypothetical protein
MSAPFNKEQKIVLAEAIRQACVEQVLTSYENARFDGLCHEGAWEVAVDSLRALNVKALVKKVEDGQAGSKP